MIQAINDYLLEKAEDNISNPLRIGNAGKCLRALALSFVGYPPKPFRIDKLFDFMLGTSIHDYITNILKEQNRLINDNKEVNIDVDGYLIRGKIDGENEDELIEIKSVKDFGFKKAKQGLIDRMYNCQIQLYMLATNHNRCRLIYVNKSYMLKYERMKSGDIKDIIYDRVVDKDEHLIDRLMNKFKVLVKTDMNNIPDNDLTEDDLWQCDYCDYDDICDQRKSLKGG